MIFLIREHKTGIKKCVILAESATFSYSVASNRVYWGVNIECRHMPNASCSRH